ncbi:MAG: TraR/DksA family transcriptional regulator [bacterium]
MTQKELKSIKTQLVQDRALLLRGITSKIDSAPRTTEAEGGDVCDIASSDRERELRLRLNERERQKLKQIEDALERIEEGTFGICDRCGEKIPFGRLKVMPSTTVCVACKTKEERQRKLYAESAGTPFSKDIGIGEFIKEEEE